MGRKPTVNTNLPSGVRARRQKSGRVFYYLDTGGKPRREIPLGDDYVLAVQKWGELTRSPIAQQRALVTFRHAAEEYLRLAVPLKAARTQKDNGIELGWLLRFFDNPPAPLDAIEPVHVRQYLDWRGASAPVRANREKALLSAICNFSRERGLTSRDNPCRGVKGFSESGRDHYTSRAVFDAVYARATLNLRDAMALAYLTGQRPADVLGFRRSDIADGVLAVVQDKTGKRLRIRLVDDAGVPNALGLLLRGILARLDAAKLVVPCLVVGASGRCMSHTALDQTFGHARAAAALAAEEAGDAALAAAVRAFQFRDLRAKAGTDTAAKTGMRAAQRQLGHASMKMTEHYIREGDLVDPTE
jgi:integrase